MTDELLARHDRLLTATAPFSLTASLRALAEGATYFTLTQRSTQWFAAARKRRIAAELGPRAVLDGVAYVAFPSLGTLRALDDAALLAYGGNGQRAGRLRQVLDGVAALD